MFQKYDVTPGKLGATYPIFVVCLISGEHMIFILVGTQLYENHNVRVP